MVPIVSCPRFFSSECKWEVCYGFLYFTFMMKPWWHDFKRMWSTIDALYILVTNNLDIFVWKMGSNAWEWIFCTLNSYKLLKTTIFLKHMFSKCFMSLTHYCFTYGNCIKLDGKVWLCTIMSYASKGKEALENLFYNTT